MYLRELSSPVTALKGAGTSAASSLSRLGINNLSALLCHYPRDWEDRSRTIPLKDWETSQVCTEVQILAHDWFGYGRMKTLKIYVEDESARACLVCFHRPFLERQFPIGKQAKLFGQFSYKYGEIQSSSFELEPVSSPRDSNGSLGPILPVYPLTAGLTQGFLRKLIKQALSLYASKLENELPESVINRDGLLHKPDAIRAIHFPASQEELGSARKTLIYEELFYLELITVQRVMERKNIPANNNSKTGTQAGLSPLQKRLIERLPFSLTPGQLEAVAGDEFRYERLFSHGPAAPGRRGFRENPGGFSCLFKSDWRW